MEYIFFLIAFMMSSSTIYLIGRFVHPTHNGLIRAFKRSETLTMMMICFTLMLWLVYAITLFAFNNTFWHLPYTN